jgi:ABC-type transport system substrate-binding protein
MAASRSDGDYNATGYANPRVDDLIDAIQTALVTYARDALIEEVWKAVREDIVYVPLHHQVIVWAMRDELELPVDPSNQPRFGLARLNPVQPATAHKGKLPPLAVGSGETPWTLRFGCGT